MDSDEDIEVSSHSLTDICLLLPEMSFKSFQRLLLASGVWFTTAL